jgi:tetratricopeptide (TPR) repeat protein
MMGSGVTAIYASNSNINIYKNKIQNNNSAGILASGSNITFGPTSASCNSGNNTITGNGIGISATYSSHIYLNSPGVSTHNNISGNTNANASASNNSRIESHSNYWGSNQLSGFQYDGTSYIASTNELLTCIPTLPFKIGVIEDGNSIVIEPSLKKVASNDVSSDIREELRRARELAYSERYREAMNIYKSILSTTKDNQYISETLNGMLFIYRITQDKELSEYLKDYSKGEANPFAKIAYANVLVVDGYVDKALLEYDGIVKNNPNTCHAIQALILQAYIYYFDKNDINKANEILVEVEKIAKEDDLDVK